MSLDAVVKHDNTLSNDMQHPHRPPVPPRPPKPMPTKNVVLTHKFNKVVYALAIRTTTDVVYDKEYKYTLTEMLSDITDALVSNFQKIAKVSEAFDHLMADCPEEFNTLKEIADYINVNGDPKSELIQLIDTKVDKEEGKGLSSNDFTDVLKAKLENDYTAEQLTEIFNNQDAINASISQRVLILEETPNIIVDDNEEGTHVPDNNVWMMLNGQYPGED